MTTPTVQKKRILIAIPTARNIEPETYKSIYDLQVPADCDVTFQYFYGYSRSQIKNLICEWAKNYDYTVFIKKDIALPANLLVTILTSSADLILLDNSLIFCARKNVFVNVQYPHFVVNNSERLELDEFILKAQATGAQTEYLTSELSL